MKEPSYFRHKPPPSSSTSIKLLCSFNGIFKLHPQTGKLRYVGGETRIISVDRKLGILQLVSKISNLCPNIQSFRIKYKLRERNGSDEDSPLVSITSDEDLRCMVEEYDRVEKIGGKHARLWVFVCRYDQNHDSSFSSSVFWNCNAQNSRNRFFGNVVSLNSLEPRTNMTHVGKVRNCDDSLKKMGLKSHNLASHARKVRNLENPFEESVCRSEISSVDSQLHGVNRDSRVGGQLSIGYYNQPTETRFQNDGHNFSVVPISSANQCVVNQGGNIEFCNQTGAIAQFQTEVLNPSLVAVSSGFNVHQCLVNEEGNSNTGFCNQPGAAVQFQNEVPNSLVVPVSSGRYPNWDFVSGRENAGFCNGRGAIMQFGNEVPLFSGLDIHRDFVSESGNSDLCNGPGSMMQLNNEVPNFIGSRNMSNHEWRNIKNSPLGNYEENVMRCTTCCSPGQSCCDPDSLNSLLVNSSVASNRVSSNLQCRFRNHRIGGADTRHQRITPYCLRNHWNNLPELGNHCNFGHDGKRGSGKCYPGLGASSSILKHGQLMRSHYTHLWKPWTHEHARDGMMRMIGSSIPAQPSSNHNISEGVTEQNIRQTDGCHVDHARRQGDLLVAEFEKPNPHSNDSENQGVYLPCINAKNPFTSLWEMNAPEELSSNSNQAKHGSEADPDPDVTREKTSLGSQMNEGISRFCMDTGYETGEQLGFASIFSLFNSTVQPDIKGDVKLSSNTHSTVSALSGAITSLVNLSLYDLSFFSSEGASPPPSSSLTSNDASDPSSRSEIVQLNPPDFMDEGPFSSSSLVQKFTKNKSSSSIECASGLERNLSSSKEDQQTTPSSLAVDEEADTSESRASPKVLGGTRSDLVGFYTRLASPELQTIKSSDLEDIRELGSGTHGTVFYGKWRGSDVAIKRIKPSCFTGGELEEGRLVADFWKEAHILGQLHHPNVVSLYGVVTDGPVTNLATVTEYMVNGSLKQVLQKKDRTIDRRKRLILAMDAAFGMEYLHEKNIVHFDLKSHNFLVNMRDPLRPVCKIGDMGLSKVKHKTLVSGGVRGTIPWMAPELLTSKKTMVTEKVDVYSFGIVMWELLTGEEPYGQMRAEETIAGIIKGDLRPEVPSWCDPAWRSLMERCWSSDPASRPSFSEIAKELRVMAAAMNIK